MYGQFGIFGIKLYRTICCHFRSDVINVSSFETSTPPISFGSGDHNQSHSRRRFGHLPKVVRAILAGQRGRRGAAPTPSKRRSIRFPPTARTTDNPPCVYRTPTRANTHYFTAKLAPHSHKKIIRSNKKNSLSLGQPLIRITEWFTNKPHARFLVVGRVIDIERAVHAFARTFVSRQGWQVGTSRRPHQAGVSRRMPLFSNTSRPEPSPPSLRYFDASSASPDHSRQFERPLSRSHRSMKILRNPASSCFATHSRGPRCVAAATVS
jgi:hypothetical protein